LQIHYLLTHREMFFFKKWFKKYHRVSASRKEDAMMFEWVQCQRKIQLHVFFSNNISFYFCGFQCLYIWRHNFQMVRPTHTKSAEQSTWSRSTFVRKNWVIGVEGSFMLLFYIQVSLRGNASFMKFGHITFVSVFVKNKCIVVLITPHPITIIKTQLSLLFCTKLFSFAFITMQYCTILWASVFVYILLLMLTALIVWSKTLSQNILFFSYVYNVHFYVNCV